MTRTCTTMALLFVGCCLNSFAQAEDGAFSRTTIDLGVVVSDVEKSMAFYKDALGFEHAGSFKVPAPFASEVGLTEQQPFEVQIMVLGKGENATKLKLMEFPNVKSKKVDHKTIHTSLGYSYLTIFVTDLNASLERAKKAGVSPIAQGPVDIPENIAPGISLAIVRDPDGNLIELVGPRK